MSTDPLLAYARDRLDLLQLTRVSLQIRIERSQDLRHRAGDSLFTLLRTAYPYRSILSSDERQRRVE